jgi:hypothetical protein
MIHPKHLKPKQNRLADPRVSIFLLLIAAVIAAVPQQGGQFFTLSGRHAW